MHYQQSLWFCFGQFVLEVVFVFRMCAFRFVTERVPTHNAVCHVNVFIGGVPREMKN